MAAIAFAEAGFFACVQKRARCAIGRPVITKPKDKAKHGQALPVLPAVGRVGDAHDTPWEGNGSA